MTQPLDLGQHGLVAISRGALAALHAALLRDAGPEAARYLQEAGYAGGETVATSFHRWLGTRGVGAPEDLELGEFERHASDYFRETGWGTLKVGSLRDAVATLDSSDWAEAEAGRGLTQPGCHLTTGMLADFFGRIAETPLAVLEVECRSAGDDRCRFLIGAADVMAHVYEEMEQGGRYEDAVAEVE
ncbi:MAG: hypothetical protein NVS1B4_20310 [Gemmatimonadaceae bacterium]